MRSPVADLLADLADALTRLDVPWYLFGARAAILYGVARMTADVDVTVRVPAGLTNEALSRTIEEHGFRRRFTDPGFVERTRVLPFVHVRTDLPADVVLAGPGLEDQFFARVVCRTVEGLEVPVASPEDLVVMKVLAGRPKDLEDVGTITSAVASLDVEYVRRTLAMVEEALGQSDFLATFEGASGRRRPR